MNSLPKTVTRQRRGCDLNPGSSAPETSTLTIRLWSFVTGNESVSKIIRNNAVNLFLSCNQHLVISNHNSFRVLFDKSCFRIFYLKNIFII